MKRIVGIGILFLGLMAFCGVVSASTSSYTATNWDSSEHPYNGKIVIRETSTSTYRGRGYQFFSKSYTVGKVLYYTKSLIKVRCNEITIRNSWDSYSGNDVDRESRIFYRTLYRSTLASTSKYSTWDTSDNPYNGKIAIRGSSTYMNKLKGYQSVSKSYATGKILSYTNSLVKIRCLETTILTSWSSYFGKDVDKQYRVFFRTLYR